MKGYKKFWSVLVVFCLLSFYPRINESSGDTNVFKYNRHEYLPIALSRTWQEAKVDCEARQGHLVTITDQEENEFVYSLVLQLGWETIWLGFTDEINEGRWLWVTGEESLYRNWDFGEPNNAFFPGEDYAHMHGGGLWNDIGPYTTFYYICEWEEELFPPNVIFGVTVLIGIGVFFMGRRWYYKRR